MIGRVGAGLLSLLLLTSCTPPGGVSGDPKPQKALLSVSLSSVDHLKTVSAYRTQDIDVPMPGVTDFTPDSYRVTIASIALIGKDGQHVEIYAGQDPVELADREAVEAALNAEAQAVEPGTYVGAKIRFGEVHAITGSATFDGKSAYTKATHEGDAAVGPAEATPIAAGGDRELDFAKPLTLEAGQNAKLSLVYDLTDSVNFYPPQAMHPDGFRFKDGSGIELKYMPFFAFVGEPPKPEIYRVTIADPEHRIEADANWHYQVVLFPKDDGSLAGLQCIGRIDEGFTGSHFSAIGFVNNRLDAHRLNSDGTYRLVGHHEGGGAFPRYEVKAFQRRDHAGKVLYFDDGVSAMTAPVELDYQATKIQ